MSEALINKDVPIFITENKLEEKGSSFFLYFLTFITVLVMSKLYYFFPTSTLPVLFSLFSTQIFFTIASIYIFYYMLKNSKRDILINIFISFSLLLATIVFPAFVILFIIWVVYRIKKSLVAIKNLLPTVIFSFFMWISLKIEMFILLYGGDENLVALSFVISSIVFIFMAYKYSKKLSVLDSKEGLLQLSVMFVSIPLVFLILASIVTGIQSLFHTSAVTVVSDELVQQDVSSYMRNDTLVEGYTRNVTKTVTDTITEHTPSIGGIGVSVVGLEGALGSVDKNGGQDKSLQSN